MVVGELIIRRHLLKKNIEDIKKFLAKKEDTYSKATYNDFVDKLFGYIEQYKNHSVLLNRSNEKTMIVVGKNELTVSDAVYIRDAILDKIKIVSSLIDNNTTKDLDIFNLVDQRDKLFEEYIYLTVLISESDWGVEIQ